jgi:hypothetical protein
MRVREQLSENDLKKIRETQKQARSMSGNALLLFIDDNITSEEYKNIREIESRILSQKEQEAEQYGEKILGQED